MIRSLYLVIICHLVVTTIMAETIEVCPSCNATTLQAAIETAKDGDQIHLKSGVHFASELLVQKRLSFSGEKGAIIDGKGLSILFINHDSVSITDLEFRNVATNYVEDRAAIKANKANYLHVQNIKVRDSFFGILIENSKYGIIENCDVVGNANKQNYLESSNGNAIHLWYCKNMQILNNKVSKHRDGIYFEFVENSQIKNNHSQLNMRYGLHFMFSHNNLYHNNIFSQNGAGVAVMYSDKVTMTNNYFKDNWGESSYGLLIKDIKDSRLENNVFYNNTIGISADNSIRVEVKNNVFSNNGYAMRIMGNCTDNNITNNDFAQNSFDITTNARTNYNNFSGNYWEEYTGYDLDRDGVGDVPHRPVKLFTYIIAQSPASIILMRSSFIDLLNIAEKVTPVLTPESLIDSNPKMKPINDLLKKGL